MGDKFMSDTCKRLGSVALLTISFSIAPLSSTAQSTIIKALEPIPTTVKNTSANPVPTTVQGVVNVQGAAAVTGVVGIDSNQNRVRIDSAGPLPTFDVDHQMRSLLEVIPMALETAADTNQEGIILYTSPNLAPGRGHFAVIDKVWVTASGPIGFRVRATVLGRPILFSYQGTFLGSDYYVAYQDIKSPISGALGLQVQTTAAASIRASASGYTIAESR
jgi:hypothetical protein